jgi:hypothetical protein
MEEEWKTISPKPKEAKEPARRKAERPKAQAAKKPKTHSSESFPVEQSRKARALSEFDADAWLPGTRIACSNQGR